MIEKILPDYKITIGIKEEKIVLVDWSEITEFKNKPADIVINCVEDYLRKAIKFIK